MDSDVGSSGALTFSNTGECARLAPEHGLKSPFYEELRRHVAHHEPTIELPDLAAATLGRHLFDAAGGVVIYLAQTSVPRRAPTMEWKPRRRDLEEPSAQVVEPDDLVTPISIESYVKRRCGRLLTPIPRHAARELSSR